MPHVRGMIYNDKTSALFRFRTQCKHVMGQSPKLELVDQNQGVCIQIPLKTQ